MGGGLGGGVLGHTTGNSKVPHVVHSLFLNVDAQVESPMFRGALPPLGTSFLSARYTFTVEPHRVLTLKTGPSLQFVHDSLQGVHRQ